MASSTFTLSPAIDLPLPIKSSATSSQSVPLFPFRPIDSPSFRYKLKRNATVSASASRSNAVSEQAIESIATDTTLDSQTTLSQPSSSKLVLVVGGTGGVGQLVVARLLDRNIRARLLLRNLEKATTLFGEQDEEKLQVRQGDTRNPSDLDPSIFEGVTHVICCTGTTAFPSRRWDGDNTPERVDWEGVRNLVSVLPSSLKRIVLVSSVGVTKCNELPWSIMNLFGVLKYKKMGEDCVRNCGLPYTIIRPGRLTDGPYTSYDLNTLLQATAGERRAVVIGQEKRRRRRSMARFCLQLNAGIATNLAVSSSKANAQRKSTATTIERVQLPEKVETSRVLILGGTGRVGGSTAFALNKFCPTLRIVIGGRNREKGAAMVKKLGENSEFLEVDISDSESLDKAFKGVDLVVHTAGPFQQSENCTVLEAAIQNKIAYLDVCDDTSYAQRAKSYMKRAIEANIPAITTGGIYPGVSNIMAAELVREAKTEGKGEPERLRFYYYTAGSGGAGPTILSTSFLLLGEEVVAYNKGEKIKLKPYTGMLNIDFGYKVGKKDVFLLNLPEVRSIHEILGVPTVSARFGTAPFFWNWGMVAMTYLLPAETLRDRSKVQELVDLFDPLVRKVDEFAGEKVSMRVDLDCSDGKSRIGIFSHRKLSESVGISTASFALAILEGSTQPGVWFPEEPEGIAVEAREVLLSRASQGTFNFIMNKAPWMVETNPKEIGFGIYT